MQWWGIDFVPPRGIPASVSDQGTSGADYTKVKRVEKKQISRLSHIDFIPVLKVFLWCLLSFQGKTMKYNSFRKLTKNKLNLENFRNSMFWKKDFWSVQKMIAYMQHKDRNFLSQLDFCLFWDKISGTKLWLHTFERASRQLMFYFKNCRLSIDFHRMKNF